MSATISIDKIGGQMPFFPKEWVIDASAFTELQDWLKNQRGCTMNAAAILQSIEDINARHTSWPIGLWIWWYLPNTCHFREFLFLFSHLSINRPIRVISQPSFILLFQNLISWLIFARLMQLTINERTPLNSLDIEFVVVDMDARLVV